MEKVYLRILYIILLHVCIPVSLELQYILQAIAVSFLPSLSEYILKYPFFTFWGCDLGCA